MDNLNVASKFLLSYLKVDWELKDYPLKYRQQGVAVSPSHNVGFSLKPWVVQVINWGVMVGVGDTREEAYKNLEQRIVDLKSSGKPLPRPGVKVPLEFAPSVEVKRYEQIATNFFDRVLGMNYRDVFISDQTGLSDFEPIWSEKFETLAELDKRVDELYGVDISNIEERNLARIFEMISKSSRF